VKATRFPLVPPWRVLLTRTRIACVSGRNPATRFRTNPESSETDRRTRPPPHIVESKNVAGIAPLPTVPSPQATGSSIPGWVELTSRANTLNVQRNDENGAVQNRSRRNDLHCAWKRGISAAV
jgi:hypothetical protein